MNSTLSRKLCLTMLCVLAHIYLTWGQSIDRQLPEGVYTISNLSQKEVLTSRIQDSYNATMFADHSEATQRWEIRQLGDNLYTAQNVGTGRYLEVANASCANRANVQTYTDAQKANQHFYLQRGVKGAYLIIPKHCPQKALNRSFNATMANVQLQNQNPFTLSQNWKIKNVTKASSMSAPPGASNSVAVYPNPVRDFFSIKGVSKRTDVLLLNMKGYVVKKDVITNTKSIIKVHHLDPGMYILRAADNSFQPQNVVIK